ncbi:MAG: peptide deformylase [Ottowia sp.]|nr:peptide deformylase [Ottowia sp.]
MALLNILHFPDPRLHKVAQPVARVNAFIHQLAQDMAQTMYAAPGVGLAATQVDVHLRVVVIDISTDKSQLITLINPEILWASEETKVWEEGCLSVPDIFDNVARPARVRVRALNLDNQYFELEADDLLAVCIQHEMDHLMGKVFVEHLSSLKQTRIKNKIKKQARKASLAK